METYSLYNNTIELVFDPSKHVYTVDGEVVSGVTTVLKVISKPALVPWAAKMTAEHVDSVLKPGVALDELEIKQLVDDAKFAHRKKANTSANLGALAHSWFEDYFAGLNPDRPFNAELRNMTEAFLRFAKTHEIHPLTMEKRLYSPLHRVAGTADLTCMIEGEHAVADYKTGKSGIYPEHFIQMGAYDICLTEEQEFMGVDKPISRHILINANAKGELYVGQSRNVQTNKNAFLSALELGRALEVIEADKKQNVERIRA
jgi:hypothetical protein